MTYSSSYQRIHRRLYEVRGSAWDYTCPCGEPAREWAYQFTGNPELYDADGNYPHSANLDDYMAMCRSCHVRFDREHESKEVTEERSERSRRVAGMINKRFRLCLQCGLITTPGPMGRHQRYLRHTGVEDIEIG